MFENPNKGHISGEEEMSEGEDIPEEEMYDWNFHGRPTPTDTGDGSDEDSFTVDPSKRHPFGELETPGHNIKKRKKSKGKVLVLKPKPDDTHYHPIPAPIQ